MLTLTDSSGKLRLQFTKWSLAIMTTNRRSERCLLHLWHPVSLNKPACRRREHVTTIANSLSATPDAIIDRTNTSPRDIWSHWVSYTSINGYQESFSSKHGGSVNLPRQGQQLRRDRHLFWTNRLSEGKLKLKLYEKYVAVVDTCIYTVRIEHINGKTPALLYQDACMTKRTPTT